MKKKKVKVWKDIDEVVKASTVANYRSELTKKADDKDAEDKKADSKGKSDKDYEYYGAETFRLLDECTIVGDQNIIKNKYIADLNKDNILPFLKGYYKNGGERTGRCCEGLIEALNDDGKVGAAELSEIIETVLEKAATMDGVKDSDEYVQLEKLLEGYNDRGCQSFDDPYNSINFFGMNTDYKEEFDKRLEALYDKMIAAEKE